MLVYNTGLYVMELYKKKGWNDNILSPCTMLNYTYLVNYLYTKQTQSIYLFTIYCILHF